MYHTYPRRFFLGLSTLVVVVGLATQAHSMGLLIPNEGGPLAIESHRVAIEINDSLATTRVTQVFRNSSGSQLEATFIFPLPTGATVSDFVLYIDGVPTHGEVLEATQARAVYENIVRQIRDPGLVEYMGGSLFQARIFPVPANGTQRVELEYAQVLEREGDLLRLTYPLQTGRTSATTLTDFTVVTEVTTSQALRTVYSPTHEIEVVREGENHAVVGLEQMHADLERDFVLYIGQSDEDIAVNVFSFDEDGPGGEDGYFLMVLAPRLEQEDEIIAKDVTFVVDTSGSMAGDKIEQARATLRYCIGQLGPHDRFNILRFATTVRPLFEDLTAVTPDSLDLANAFVDEIRASGGTAINEALQLALSTEDSERPHMIIFVTDGLPTVGETQPDAIVQAVEGINAGKNARIFTFGVGYDVDTFLLDLVATNNGGNSDYVRPEEDLELAVNSLYDRISHPVLTGVEIDFGGAGVYDVFPRSVPDLFAGTQAVFTGRYRSEVESSITVRGTAREELRVYESAQRFDGAADVANPHDYVPALWATRKVGFLLDQIRLNGELPELRDEVISLSTRFGIVTPYTSYLAVAPGETWNTTPGWNSDPFMDDDLGGVWGGRGLGDGELEVTSGADFAPRPIVPSPTETPEAEEAAPRWDNRDVRSGEDAVDTTEALNEHRERETALTRAPVRQVGPRAMRLWSDGSWRQDGTEDLTDRLEISYLSEAYFELLTLRPDLVDSLSLGERVEVLTDDGAVISIVDAGVDTLTEEWRLRLAR